MKILTNIHDFIFEVPLYTLIKKDDETSKELLQYVRPTGKVDGYSISLKQETTYDLDYYSLGGGKMTSYDLYDFQGYNVLEARCVRTGEKITIVTLLSIKENQDDDGTITDCTYAIIKMGQYPTIADMHITKVKDYNRVLDKHKIREFTRAIGLAASGVGIGSFVYLRRIFEHLLEIAHIRAKNDQGWIEDDYCKARVDEKISLLRQHLPEFLVSNKIIYSILSKGIHELTEEECLSYFEPLKAGIEQILDEKVAVYLKEAKLEKAKQAINLIHQSISGAPKN